MAHRKSERERRKGGRERESEGEEGEREGEREGGKRRLFMQRSHKFTSMEAPGPLAGALRERGGGGRECKKKNPARLVGADDRSSSGSPDGRLAPLTGNALATQ